MTYSDDKGERRPDERIMHERQGKYYEKYHGTKIQLTVETKDQGKGEQHSQEADRLRHAANPINPNLRTVPMVVEIDPSPRAEARPCQDGQKGKDGPPDVIDAFQTR